MLTAIPDWPEEIVQNSLISLSFFRSLSLFAWILYHRVVLVSEICKRTRGITENEKNTWRNVREESISMKNFQLVIEAALNALKVNV